jgi:hypothetical protein
MKNISEIFDNMDKWRHLPAYQLERRADIFFSIYLPEILFYKFGVDIEGVIPEFPIRIGSIYDQADTNKSFKVDYFAKGKDAKIILLVELKTDENSRRDKQDWYLEKAKEVGLVELLKGVRKIYKATGSKKKYQHLLDELQKLGLISQHGNGEFDIAEADYEIRTAYIQPNNADEQGNIISFRDISHIIEQHGDELSLRFSKSLLIWSATKAGE